MCYHLNRMFHTKQPYMFRYIALSELIKCIIVHDISCWGFQSCWFESVGSCCCVLFHRLMWLIMFQQSQYMQLLWILDKTCSFYQQFSCIKYITNISTYDIYNSIQKQRRLIADVRWFIMNACTRSLRVNVDCGKINCAY